jgi:hypothetical protein
VGIITERCALRAIELAAEFGLPAPYPLPVEVVLALSDGTKLRQDAQHSFRLQGRTHI